MSTWRELCAAYDEENNQPDCDVQPKCLLVYLPEFDKLRFVVEAALYLLEQAEEEGQLVPAEKMLQATLKDLGAIE